MDNYINFLKNIKGFSNNTLRTYQQYVQVLIDNNLDYSLSIEKYSKNSNSTKRIILSAFKSYLKFIDNDAYKEITLPKKNRKICSYVSFKDYNTIISNIKLELKTQFCIYLVIRMLYETGIRSSELLSIEIPNIFDQKIKIFGKGNKERYVYLSHNLYQEIKKYVKKYKKANLLFDFKYKNLYKRIKNLSPIISKQISPHSFRRGFATYCINKNISIFDISMMMGHSQIETTKSYIYEINYENKMKNLFI